MVYDIDVIKYKVENIARRKDSTALPQMIIDDKVLQARKDKVKFLCQDCDKEVVIHIERFLRTKNEEKTCWYCSLHKARKDNPLRFRSPEAIEKMRQSIRDRGVFIDKYEERICPTCKNKFTIRVARFYKKRKFCSEKCRREAFAIAGSKQGHHGYKGMLAVPMRDTKPEKLFKAYLDSKGISYTFQKKVGPFMFDFGLSNGILIEIDGDYWHYNINNPLITAKPINSKQAKKVARDKEKDEYCKKHSIVLVRIWESELKSMKILQDFI
jgi:G:T-mismatch repair DNA endonuclease (very short patch repair protein)